MLIQPDVTQMSIQLLPITHSTVQLLICIWIQLVEQAGCAGGRSQCGQIFSGERAVQWRARGV